MATSLSHPTLWKSGHLPLSSHTLEEWLPPSLIPHSGRVATSLSHPTLWKSGYLPLSSHTLEEWPPPSLIPHSGRVATSLSHPTLWKSGHLPLSSHTLEEWPPPSLIPHSGRVATSLSHPTLLTLLLLVGGTWSTPRYWQRAVSYSSTHCSTPAGHAPTSDNTALWNSSYLHPTHHHPITTLTHSHSPLTYDLQQ